MTTLDEVMSMYAVAMWRKLDAEIMGLTRQQVADGMKRKRKRPRRPLPPERAPRVILAQPDEHEGTD